jgi:hypothetical protein
LRLDGWGFGVGLDADAADAATVHLGYGVAAATEFEAFSYLGDVA